MLWQKYLIIVLIVLLQTRHTELKQLLEMVAVSEKSKDGLKISKLRAFAFDDFTNEIGSLKLDTHWKKHIKTLDASENEIPKFTVSLDIKNLGGGYVKGNKMENITLCYDSNFVEPANFGDFDEDTSTDNCLIINKFSSADKQKKLDLVGQTNQWINVYAEFSVTGEVAVQDITGFSAEIEYTYYQDII